MKTTVCSIQPENLEVIPKRQKLPCSVVVYRLEKAHKRDRGRWVPHPIKKETCDQLVRLRAARTLNNLGNGRHLRVGCIPKTSLTRDERLRPEQRGTVKPEPYFLFRKFRRIQPAPPKKAGERNRFNDEYSPYHTPDWLAEQWLKRAKRNPPTSAEVWEIHQRKKYFKSVCIAKNVHRFKVYGRKTTVVCKCEKCREDYWIEVDMCPYCGFENGNREVMKGTYLYMPKHHKYQATGWFAEKALSELAHEGINPASSLVSLVEHGQYSFEFHHTTLKFLLGRLRKRHEEQIKKNIEDVAWKSSNTGYRYSPLNLTELRELYREGQIFGEFIKYGQVKSVTVYLTGGSNKGDDIAWYLKGHTLKASLMKFYRQVSALSGMECIGFKKPMEVYAKEMSSVDPVGGMRKALNSLSKEYSRKIDGELKGKPRGELELTPLMEKASVYADGIDLDLDMVIEGTEFESLTHERLQDTERGFDPFIESLPCEIEPPGDRDTDYDLGNYFFIHGSDHWVNLDIHWLMEEDIQTTNRHKRGLSLTHPRKLILKNGKLLRGKYYKPFPAGARLTKCQLTTLELTINRLIQEDIAGELVRMGITRRGTCAQEAVSQFKEAGLKNLRRYVAKNAYQKEFKRKISDDEFVATLKPPEAINVGWTSVRQKDFKGQNEIYLFFNRDNAYFINLLSLIGLCAESGKNESGKGVKIDPTSHACRSGEYFEMSECKYDFVFYRKIIKKTFEEWRKITDKCNKYRLIL